MLSSDFWSKVDVRAPDECWEWTASLNGRYGKFAVKVPGTRRTRMFYAHRRAWELSLGRPVPDGMDVCHTCDNPKCCNPDHLWVGTRKQNMADMVAKGRSRSGEKHHGCRLSDAQVDEIRLLANDPEMTGRSLAARFGVSPTSISRIINGKQRVPGLVEAVSASSLANPIGESLSVVGAMPHSGGLVPQRDSRQV